MPVLVTCKFDKDPIKGDWEKLETSFFHRSRASNSKMTGKTRPKFELVRDFMPVLVTCKFDEDWIHSNWEKMETPFSPFKDFMPVLVTCKFDKDPIKGDWENAETW